METKANLAVRVGIFIVIGIVFLLWLSLRVDESLFKKPEGMELKAFFNDAKGLEIGSPVKLAGLDVGSVTSMNFDSEKGKVEVDMFINSPYKLKKDSVASIRLQTLLGQHYVGVDFGEPSSPDLSWGASVQTAETIDVDKALQIIGEVGEEIKILAKDFSENEGKLSEKITSLIDENRENIRKTTESFANIGPNINTSLESFNEILNSVKKGEGTLGRFFTDDTLYERFTNMADGFTSMTSDVRNGNGALSQLIYSDDLIVSGKEAISSVKDAAGNLSKLIQDHQGDIDAFLASLGNISPKLEDTMTQVKEISQKVNEGEGTLGKLVNDPSLYNDTKNAVNQIKATFDESEEQSVVKTVLAVVLGAVM
ncbi:MCE family protein [Candidatus Sumerlaeota bacterium]|nr:MCE family protein [Candidatus Sumerlaeota bacterium]